MENNCSNKALKTTSKCNQHLGELKRVMVIPTYSHLMSSKIRNYYILKECKNIGLDTIISIKISQMILNNG